MLYNNETLVPVFQKIDGYVTAEVKNHIKKKKTSSILRGQNKMLKISVTIYNDLLLLRVRVTVRRSSSTLLLLPLYAQIHLHGSLVPKSNDLGTIMVLEKGWFIKII